MTLSLKAAGPAAPPAEPDLIAAPFALRRPDSRVGPLVFASPHSGRVYPESFIDASVLDPLTLRASEDAYVDDLFAAAPDHGAPLIAARFPRAYLDANRDPWELDPRLFAEPLPSCAKTRTPRVAAGLGVVPRIVADGTEIYAGPITLAEADLRLRRLHRPYHAALERLLTDARDSAGAAILIDCHSMPAPVADSGRRAGLDVVLGDRYGAAAAQSLISFIESTFRNAGYRVARNTPYAGGYSTERYGRPDRRIHAVQIELNRALYLDASTMAPGPNYDAVKRDMTRLVRALSRAPLHALTP